MGNSNDKWYIPWLVRKLGEEGLAAEATSNQQVQVVCKNGQKIRAAIVDQLVVSEGDVLALIQQTPPPQMIVSIPKDGTFDLDAHRVAGIAGIRLRKFGDFLSAVKSDTPLTFVSQDISFIERVLRQHSRVKLATRLGSRLYRIERNNLEVVFVLFMGDYELTAESVRRAIDEHQSFQAICLSNPYGRVSTSARQVLTAGRLRCYNMSDLLRALHDSWNF